MVTNKAKGLPMNEATKELAAGDLKFALKLLENGDVERAYKYAALATTFLHNEAEPCIRIINGVKYRLSPAEYQKVVSA
jgi:hypothetical protein